MMQRKTLEILSVLVLFIFLTVLSIFYFYDGLPAFGGDKKLYSRIETYYQVGEYSSALSMISEFFIKYPSSPLINRVRLYYGRMMAEEKRYEKAREIIHLISIEDSADKEMLIEMSSVLGKIIRESGISYSGEIVMLENILMVSTGKHKEMIAEALGYAYLNMNQEEKALRYFKQSYSPNSILGRIRVYLRLKSYRLATFEMLNFMEQYPSNEDVMEVGDALVKTACKIIGEDVGRKRYREAAGLMSEIKSVIPYSPVTMKIEEYYDRRIRDIRKKKEQTKSSAEKKKPVFDSGKLYDQSVIDYENGRLKKALEGFWLIKESPDSDQELKDYSIKWIEIIQKEMKLSSY